MSKHQDALNRIVSNDYLYFDEEINGYRECKDTKRHDLRMIQELVDKVESKTTAKEMFEKLGFSIDEQDEEVIAYSDENYRVLFYFINKTYSFYRKEDDVSSWVHVVVHQAITQQLKELGWLE